MEPRASAVRQRPKIGAPVPRVGEHTASLAPLDGLGRPAGAKSMSVRCPPRQWAGIHPRGCRNTTRFPRAASCARMHPGVREDDPLAGLPAEASPRHRKHRPGLPQESRQRRAGDGSQADTPWPGRRSLACTTHQRFTVTPRGAHEVFQPQPMRRAQCMVWREIE